MDGNDHAAGLEKGATKPIFSLGTEENIALITL